MSDGATPAAPAPAPVLDGDTLRRALLALADDDAVRAAAILDGASGSADVRAGLVATVLGGGDRAARAALLGDRLLAAGASQDVVNEAYRAAFYLGPEAVALAAENPLFQYALAQRSGPAMDLWVHYLPVYHRHLERFRDRPVRVLEIGVYRGGGLAMWRHYFGPQATIVGLDVDPAAREAGAATGAVVELGDQADPEALRRLHRDHGPFDVVLDDGGHRMDQQITTGEVLFPLLAEGGVLVVQDTHTSYWPEYSGGAGRSGTFMEWTKDRLDDLHWRYTRTDPATSAWTAGLESVHVYDSLVVLEKRTRPRPFNEVVGTSDYLRTERAQEAHLLDLVSARDAARLELEALEQEVLRAGGRPAVQAPEEASTADELRRAQAALRFAHDELARAGTEAAALLSERDSLNGQLQESWDQVHLMRRSVSWRLTAPIRAVRSLLR